MANATTPITRALNKQFKAALPAGCRIQAGIYGSFASVRISDPGGLLTMRIAHEVMKVAGHLFVEAKIAKYIRPMEGVNWHMDGVVSNWELV
jgi:hypothetical protein